VGRYSAILVESLAAKAVFFIGKNKINYVT